MDGFTGLETATTEEPPEAVAVIDPFHVVRLAGDALDQCRRRVQQQTCGHRGRTGDPLRLPPDVAHRRRPAHRQAEDQAAGAVHDRQARRRGGRLVGLPANDRCVPAPRPQTGRTPLNQLIDTLRRGAPSALSELITLSPALRRGAPSALSKLITLSPALHRRAADVPAYPHRPGTSNGPTEAIKGRLKHPRGSALSFRNRINHIARSDTPEQRLQTTTTPSIVKSRTTSQDLVTSDRQAGLREPGTSAWPGAAPPRRRVC